MNIYKQFEDLFGDDPRGVAKITGQRTGYLKTSKSTVDKVIVTPKFPTPIKPPTSSSLCLITANRLRASNFC